MIADSNVIIARLTTLFAASVVIPVLTPEQRAIAHAATRMVEEHLAQTGFYYRYGACICMPDAQHHMHRHLRVHECIQMHMQRARLA